MSEAIGAVFIGIFMFWMGWIFAHDEVSTECQRQGSFYVGDLTFECKEKK